MPSMRFSANRFFLVPGLLISGFALGSVAFAQEVFAEMPRYDRYQKLARAQTFQSGVASVVWDEDGKGVTFTVRGKTSRYDFATGVITEVTAASTPTTRRAGGARQAPERGRQFDTATSADGKWTAVTRDRNVYVKGTGVAEKSLTTDGSVDKRIKNGVASWVYGEELNVREAMWWSPDSSRLAYYRFDETSVKDYYLALAQTEFQSTLDTEAYPKAGTVNPVVQLRIANPTTGASITVDTQFGDATLGEYVYDVKWSPDGKELFFNRTNRKQNVMQFCAADPTTGKSRVIMEERQPQSWAENHPNADFLKDQQRFIWSSEQGGFKNLYLADLKKGLLNPITKLKRDVLSIVRVDEAKNRVFYTAAGLDNPYFIQLHVATLDGKTDKVLTDQKFNHSVNLAPDGEKYVTVRQTPDSAPETVLVQPGKPEVVLAKSDLTEWEKLGLKKTELFKFKAADGVTDCFGTVQFPSDFDPSKKYPVVLSVYAGPESGGPQVGFRAPSPLTEMGFLVVNLAGRGTNGRGKAFRDAVYGKLGVVEIDDQAAGIKELGKRAYVDPARVGIYGTSYGGYASIMAILRHPGVFRTACASSSVTDWRHYDTIYTERFMGLPAEGENKTGYEAGSAFTYAKELKGNLMLYIGTSDNNVHPANTYMFIRSLERAGKRYDMQVGPDQGHTQMNTNRMWEYFVKTLILDPKMKPQAKLVPGGLKLKFKDQQG